MRSVCESAKRLFVSIAFVLILGLTLGAMIPIHAVAQEQPACSTTSGHVASLVDVGNDVSVEVLDWGGDGRVLIFLAGLGNSGHVFDYFALNFSPEFRVMAVTRRGFGASSKPDSGYAAADRSKDVIGVMDKLGVDEAFFVGHSLAGDELSYIGANFATRVQGLVYLDAFDYGDHTLDSLFARVPEDIQNVDNPTSRDSLSLGHAMAYLSRVRSLPVPYAELIATSNVDKDGRFISDNVAPQAFEQIVQGVHEANFESIVAPALGIFASSGELVRESKVAELSPESRLLLPVLERALQSWSVEQIVRFESRLPNGRVEVIEGGHHYIFLSHAGKTVDLMLEFFKLHSEQQELKASD